MCTASGANKVDKDKSEIQMNKRVDMKCKGVDING